ncbi:MAG: hypothetical protein AB7T27_04560 [Kiritimatiellia bacterium]
MFQKTHPAPARKPGRAGPVLAIALGSLLIAATLAATVTWSRRLHGQHQMVRRDLRMLVRAGERCFREYGIWPSPHSGQYGDFRYGRDFPNAFVLNILRAVDGDGNTGHGVNTRRLVLISPGAAAPGVSGLNEAGSLVDPWGEPYQIVLDTDLDNSCQVENSVYGAMPGYGMVVWSCGPDRISDTEDDVCSWTK